VVMPTELTSSSWEWVCAKSRCQTGRMFSPFTWEVQRVARRSPQRPENARGVGERERKVARSPP